jgi:hypothetical protein
MSTCSTIDFGNPYRFDASSSNVISILNSANDACRKCWSMDSSSTAVSAEIWPSIRRLMRNRERQLWTEYVRQLEEQGQKAEAAAHQEKAGGVASGARCHA